MSSSGSLDSIELGDDPIQIARIVDHAWRRVELAFAARPAPPGEITFRAKRRLPRCPVDPIAPESKIAGWNPDVVEMAGVKSAVEFGETLRVQFVLGVVDSIGFRRVAGTELIAPSEQPEWASHVLRGGFNLGLG